MIFFDIGNTLEDESVANAWRIEQAARRLSELGVPADSDEIMRRMRQCAGRRCESPFRQAIAQLSSNSQVTTEVLRVASWRKDLLRLREGATEVVAALTRHHQLGIIANQSGGAQERFRAYGIAHHFKVIISSFNVGISKPDPRIFQLAIEQAGGLPAEHTMVGDRLDNDIRPAKSIGMRTIRVLGCHHDEQSPCDDMEQPDRTIKELVHLLDAAIFD